VPAAPSMITRRLPLTLALAAMAFLVASCATMSARQPEILIGTAHSAEGAISIESGDWTYGVALDGVSWTDANGSWHDSGRPECLAPSETTIPVRFAAIEVTVDGVTWRPVVWVSCEG